MALQLHKWQNEAIAVFLKEKKLIMNVTTGAGKSIAAIECIKALRELNPNYNILIVVPKIILLETLWMPELRKHGLGIENIGVYYGFAKEFSKITITTTASIKNIPLEVFDVLIVDEVHHFMTPKLLKLLSHNFEYMLGLSASIYNEQQKHWQLMEKFDYNIYKYDTRQAIADGIINKFIFYDIAVQIDEPEIKEKYVELQKNVNAMLAKLGGFENYMRLPADNRDKLHLQKLFNDRNEMILNYKKKLDITANIIEEHKDKKILVFNQYNKISTKLTWHLREKYIKSKIIDSNVDREDRINIIKEYEANKFNVLLTSKVFDEGYNLTSIEVIIIISGSSTQRQTIQRIGRVLRKKKDPSLIYQLYVDETFEADHAFKRSEEFKDIAVKYNKVKI
jgi:superfamily II DNA or RNA helicase